MTYIDLVDLVAVLDVSVYVSLSLCAHPDHDKHDQDEEALRTPVSAERR